MPAMDYSQVAHWYDIYVKTNIDIPFFLNETRHRDRVLELTSGTGRLSIPLIEAGVSLTCVDNSPEMLAILHQKLAAKDLSATIYDLDIGEKLAFLFIKAIAKIVPSQRNIRNYGKPGENK